MSTATSQTRRLRRAAAVTWTVTMLGTLLAACSAFGADDPYSGLPAKPADFVQVIQTYSDIPGGTTLPGDAGVFEGPHFALRVHSIHQSPGVDDVLASLLDYDQGFRPAPGHTFLMAKMHPQPLSPRWGTDPTPQAAVRVAGRVTKLDSLPEPGEVVIISVPDGAGAQLQVTDDDHTQTFDLWRGQRAADSTTPLYPVRTTPLPARLYDDTGSTRWSGVNQRVQVILTSAGGQASLEPYLPGAGWARPGRAWLLLTPLHATSATEPFFNPARGYFDVALDLSTERSFSLRLPSGLTIQAERTPAISTQIAAEPFSIYFDVPATFHQGRLTITPTGPMATITESPTMQDFIQLRPRQDCGSRTIPCLKWSSPPPERSIQVSLPRPRP